MPNKFYLCIEKYQASGRLARTWIVEADERPDTPKIEDAERATSVIGPPYPFNGMGGSVEASFDTLEEAEIAEAEMWT